jgi:hypothetical protein
MFAAHLARQARLIEQFEGEVKEYQEKLDAWELKRKKKKGDVLDSEPRPEAPVLEHVFTTDATIEAIARIFEHGPRGPLVMFDELSSFFGGMGRYARGGADADRGFWLSLYSAVPYKSDRATRGTVFIPKAGASIVGGIQPDVLRRCFDPLTFASGLASRFLLVLPPARIKEYRRGPSREERQAYDDLINGLFQIEMEPYSRADGQVGERSMRLPFADDARDLLRDFVPHWSEEAISSAESVEAAMSKLEGYALRFSLVLRVAREVLGRAKPEDPISRADLENGIRLARWFKNEAVRVYRSIGSLQENAPGSGLEARAEIIRRRFGGAVTVREWHKRNTRVPYAQAGSQLQEIVDAGLARWRERIPGKSGGSPTQECALLDSGDGEPSGDEVPGSGLRVAGGGGEGIASPPRHKVEKEDDGEEDGQNQVRGSNPQPTTPTAPHPGACSRPWQTIKEPGLAEGISASTLSEERPAESAPSDTGGPCNPRRPGFGAPAEPEEDLEEPPESSHPCTREAEEGSPIANGKGPHGGGRTPRNPQPATHNRHSPDPSDEFLGQVKRLFDAEDVDLVIVRDEPFLPRRRGLCRCCGESEWWRLRDRGDGEPGSWVCARCHPPGPSADLIETRERDGGQRG